MYRRVNFVINGNSEKIIEMSDITDELRGIQSDITELRLTLGDLWVKINPRQRENLLRNVKLLREEVNSLYDTGIED